MVMEVVSYPPLHKQSRHWHQWMRNEAMKLMKVKPPVRTALDSIHLHHNLQIQTSRAKTPQSASAEIKTSQARRGRATTTHPPYGTQVGAALTQVMAAIQKMAMVEMSNREPPRPNKTLKTS